MSGKFIFESIVQKVHNRLGFLYRQARFLLDARIKVLLCSALIQCHLDYACCAWCTGLSKCFEKKLQITNMSKQNSKVYIKPISLPKELFVSNL